MTPIRPTPESLARAAHLRRDMRSSRWNITQAAQRLGTTVFLVRQILRGKVTGGKLYDELCALVQEPRKPPVTILRMPPPTHPPGSDAPAPPAWVEHPHTPISRVVGRIPASRAEQVARAAQQLAEAILDHEAATRRLAEAELAIKTARHMAEAVGLWANPLPFL